MTPRAVRHDPSRRATNPKAETANVLISLVLPVICNQGVAGSNPAAGTNKINDLEQDLREQRWT